MITKEELREYCPLNGYAVNIVENESKESISTIQYYVTELFYEMNEAHLAIGTEGLDRMLK